MEERKLTENKTGAVCRVVVMKGSGCGQLNGGWGDGYVTVFIYDRDFGYFFTMLHSTTGNNIRIWGGGEGIGIAIFASSDFSIHIKTATGMAQ